MLLCQKNSHFNDFFSTAIEPYINLNLHLFNIYAPFYFYAKRTARSRTAH